MRTAPSIDDILARVPQLNEHTVAPPALSFLANARDIERDLRDCIEAAPTPEAYAALGNALARRALYLPARDAYLRAVDLDPSFAAAHLAVAELSSLLRDDDAAHEALTHALALSRRYDDPMPVGSRTPIVLLLADAPYAVNAPLELIVDRTRFAVHKLYLGATPKEAPPPYACVLCAFPPGAVAAAFGDAVLNPRDAIAGCARERLAGTLGNCDGVRVVPTRLVSCDELARVALPALVRPAGTQAGFGLAKIENVEELHAHGTRFPSNAYHVSPFVEYVSHDGYYRKYRIVIVGGVAFPYHLAISPRWMVHYFSSPMEEHAWMREEELAFLEDPHSAFPEWDSVTTAIARALRLDYVGLDVAKAQDGSMLVFEADPTMLVHDEEPAGTFAYKRPAVARIRDALASLLGG